MPINVELAKRIDSFIRTQSGGTHRELAEKLDISQSTLTRQINHMKEHGAPIAYDYINRRHYYEKAGKFIVDIRFAA